MDLRRKKLSELLNGEEAKYHQELIDTQESPEDVRRRMEAELKLLKAQRLNDRDTNVQKLQEKRLYYYFVHYYLSLYTDELRKNDSEAFAVECYLEQENQMLDKLKRREKEKKEEMFYVKLNEFEIEKKKEKEKEEEKAKKDKLKNIYVAEVFQGVLRSVVHAHDQVGGVEVDAHAARSEGIEKFAEQLAGFGTGLDREGRFHGVRVFRQFTAGFAHDLAGLVFLGGDGSDVGGDDVAFQLLRQIEHSLGLFHVDLVVVGIHEAVAEVAAEGGEAETVGLDDVEGLADLVFRHVFRRELPVGGIRLNALDAEFSRFFHARAESEPEGLYHCADFHKYSS